MRKICDIAYEITKLWKKPYFGAVPYIEAMKQLETINDMYYFDSAKEIVNYFLANATYWKGTDARRIKQELKNIINNG